MDGTSDAARTLADHGRAIWGDRTASPGEVLEVLATVVGDVARAVRDHREGGTDEALAEALRRELGNLALSSLRLAAEVGLDPVECVVAAAEAQRAYVQRRTEATEVDRP